LHGDTTLNCGYDVVIRHILQLDDCVAGAFKFKIEDNERILSPIGLRMVEWATNLRAKYLQMPYGDQSLFMKRSVFEEMGGFPLVNMMEDFALVQELKKKGKIFIANMISITCGKRWKKLGLIKCTLLNQSIILAYMLGVDTRTLRNWYYKN